MREREKERGPGYFRATLYIAVGERVVDFKMMKIKMLGSRTHRES